MDLLIIVPAVVSAFIVIIAGYLTGGFDAVLSLSVSRGLFYLFSQVQFGACVYINLQFPKIKWYLFFSSLFVVFTGNHNAQVVSAFSSMSVVSLVVFELALIIFGFFIAMLVDDYLL